MTRSATKMWKPVLFEKKMKCKTDATTPNIIGISKKRYMHIPIDRSDDESSGGPTLTSMVWTGKPLSLPRKLFPSDSDSNCTNSSRSWLQRVITSLTFTTMSVGDTLLDVREDIGTMLRCTSERRTKFVWKFCRPSRMIPHTCPAHCIPPALERWFHVTNECWRHKPNTSPSHQWCLRKSELYWIPSIPLWMSIKILEAMYCNILQWFATLWQVPPMLWN
jgi:hypothetical protein